MPRPVTTMRIRHDREALVDGTGESHEIDFDIPFRFAIQILATELEVNIGDQDGAAITVDALLDYDGPALASDALSTQALFEAREILDSAFHTMHSKHDAVTTGAALMSERSYLWYPEPILTARNIGFAGLALGASGEVWAKIYYRWVEITREEQVDLFAAGRA